MIYINRENKNFSANIQFSGLFHKHPFTITSNQHPQTQKSENSDPKLTNNIKPIKLKNSITKPTTKPIITNWMLIFNINHRNRKYSLYFVFINEIMCNQINFSSVINLSLFYSKERLVPRVIEVCATKD